jgi:hypothetical protein
MSLPAPGAPLLATSYAGHRIANPFGKASGQLSLNLAQVERDADAGLGFCVLKTVVAQDAQGARSMGAWAIPASHMTVERIRGTRVDEDGWTVTWKGRGWSGTFQEYLTFVEEAVRLGTQRGMLVVPSCTFHVPADPDGTWNTSEYEFTVNALLDAWERGGGAGPMPLEKDFSPTLAGSDMAAQQAAILRWLDDVPRLIRRAAGSRPIVIGMKLFNAMFDDAFQVEMLNRTAIRREDGADYVVYANRLFDPVREFEGTRGVAYGGPDLSARNLQTLDMFLAQAPVGELLPISATGNIDSGIRAAEYLLRGCGSFQVHTFFQLPDDQYTTNEGTKVERAMRDLLHHPVTGFVPALARLRAHYGWGQTMTIEEIVAWCVRERPTV